MAVLTTRIIPDFSVVEMVGYLYQDLDLIGEFLSGNPDIGALGVNADLAQFSGADVSYDPSLSNPDPAPLSFSEPPALRTTGTVTGQPTTSIYDLTLQAYGTLDLVVDLMVENSVEGVRDQDVSRPLTYRLSKARSQQTNRYNTMADIVYATKWDQTPPPIVP